MRRKVTKRRGSTSAWRKLRRLCLLRDGFKCAVPNCPEPATHADHIIPVSKGGKDELANLQALCAAHNIAKGTGSLPEPGINPTKGNPGKEFQMPSVSPTEPKRYVPRLP